MFLGIYNKISVAKNMILNLKSFWLQASLRYFLLKNLSKELRNETLKSEKKLQFFCLFWKSMHMYTHISLIEKAECIVKRSESFSRVRRKNLRVFCLKVSEGAQLKIHIEKITPFFEK